MIPRQYADPASAGAAEGFTPWPQEAAARYREAGYWQGEPLGDLIRASARRHPGRTALIDPVGVWTYARLDEEADRTAAGLAELGIERGQRVVVQLPNVAEFVVLLVGLFRLGAVPVLALPSHRRSEVAHLCRQAGAVAYAVADRHEGFDYRELARELVAEAPDLRHVLVHGEAAEFTPLAGVRAAPRALPAPGPAEVALLLLSGGTTGVPKLIPRTHDDYAYNVRASAEVAGFDTDTVYLVALPAAHNFALACPGLLGALWAGGTVVLAPNPSPPDTFRLVEHKRVTAVALVPTLALLWADAAPRVPGDLSSLRLVQVGGARLAPEGAARVTAALGCTLQQVFGMAEGLLNMTRIDDPADVVAGTQGRPISPADELLIVDESGEPVAAGECGELLTRGPYTLRGYYRAPEHNRTAFGPQGHYRTGDLVRVTADGNLVVEGRVKDQINRAGEKIAAAELEAHLTAHPSVREAAVVGVADPGLGERTWAFVLTTGGQPPTLGEIRRLLADRGVAAYKTPDRLEVVDSWPLTGVGKVDKKALARTAEGLRAAGRRPAAPQSSTITVSDKEK